MVYKSLNDLVPGYLSSKFVKRYDTCYSVPFPRTDLIYEEKLLFSRSGILWNSLPCDMREAKSLSQFKGLPHLNFCFFKYCVHGIHDKQVSVRLVVDSFAYCLGQL